MRRARNITILIAALVVFAVEFRPAGAAVDSELEAIIASVLWNTSELNSEAGGAPDQSDIEAYRRASSTTYGTGYAYRNELRDEIDNKTIIWLAEVVVLPEGWERNPETEEAWRPHFVEEDSLTGGPIYFREKTSQETRYTRVYNMFRDRNIQLKMWITRQGDETWNEAVDKAIPRWRFFVEEAARQGLIELNPEILVWYQEDVSSDFAGLEDAGVFNFVHNHGESVEVPLKVQAQGPGIVADEPYKLFFKLNGDQGRSGVTLLDAYGDELTGGGPDEWQELTVERGDTELDLNLRFDDFDIGSGGNLEDRVLDQIARLRFYYPGASGEDGEEPLPPTDDSDLDAPGTGRTDVALQRTTWMPVVRRFQLVPNHAGRPALPGEPSPDPACGSLSSDAGNQFTAYRIKAADLAESWKKLEQEARTRSGGFGENEPVLLGWHYDDAETRCWNIADNRVGEPTFSPTERHNPLVPIIEIQINPGSPQIGAGGFDALPGEAPPDDPDFGGGEEEILSDWEREEKIRNLVFVENYELSMRRVSCASFHLPDGSTAETIQAYWEQVRPELDKEIRKPVIEAEQTDPDNPDCTSVLMPVISGTQAGQKIDGLFPMSEWRCRPKDYSCDPQALRQLGMRAWTGGFKRLSRLSGIYELRLKLDLYYKTPSDKREIDVAIRYAVAKGHFSARTLQWTTGRLSTKQF